MSWARRRSSSVVSRSTWPISRRYMRTPSDVEPSPRAGIRVARLRRRRLSRRSSAGSSASCSNVSTGRLVRRLVVPVVVAFVDLLLDADALARQGVAGRFEDVAGQLDVAQDEGDLLGVDTPGGAAALGELGPLLGVDTWHRQRRSGVRVAPRPSPGPVPEGPGWNGVASVPPCCSLLHAAMEPT